MAFRIDSKEKFDQALTTVAKRNPNVQIIAPLVDRKYRCNEGKHTIGVAFNPRAVKENRRPWPVAETLDFECPTCRRVTTHTIVTEESDGIISGDIRKITRLQGYKID